MPATPPKYIRTKQKLIEMIRSGKWPAGSAFPSEVQLLSKFRVSRPTLVRSLQDLVREGYLYRRQGQGTFVADPRGSEKLRILPLVISQAITLRRDDDQHIFKAILDGMEAALRGRGWTLQVCPVDENGLNEEGRKLFTQSAPEVAVVYPTELPAMERVLATIGAAHVWYLGEPMNNQNCVYIDEERAGYLATRHLIENGRRRIAIVNNSYPYWGFAARYRGYLQALEEAGITPDPQLSKHDWHVIDSEAGRLMMRQLLASGVTFDGVFACSDRKAIGALMTLKEAGIKVPDQVSLVSMDDTMAAMATPPISAVHLPFREMGAAVVSRAIEPQPLGMAYASVTQIKLEPVLTSRESVSRIEN